MSFPFIFSFNDENSNSKIMRIFKTLFFLVSMAISFLIFSAPLLLVFITDTLLPSALFSASLSPNSSFTLNTISSLLHDYRFQYSLIDIPIISLLRSILIIFVYSLCDGPKLSRGPYMATTTTLSTLSLMFVSIKAGFVFSSAATKLMEKEAYFRGLEIAIFLSSIGLAFAHIIVAYRISCRERRKLLVYRIDVEAVSGGKIGFYRYQKLLQEERLK